MDVLRDSRKPKKPEADMLFVKWTPVLPYPNETELGRLPTMEDYDKHFGD
jgi:hypothetical protein